MGLVERRIEEAGIPSICLSNIPELTAAVGVPRLVGIEHPFGQTVGRPGDHIGQTAVLRATFGALQEMRDPGSLEHLPFKWPKGERVTRSPSLPLPPIATHLQRHPWQFPRLLSRDIPG